MSRTTKIINISLSPSLYEEINEIAKKENRTRSELLVLNKNKKWVAVKPLILYSIIWYLIVPI